MASNTASSATAGPNGGNQLADSSETETEDDLDLIYWPFHSIGEPDATLVPKDPICRSISKLFGQLPYDGGEYAFGGAATMLPSLPGFYINGVGDISLPLRRENAAAVESYGVKLREKVWMCIADDLEVKNPEWDTGIKTLCNLAAERLGLTTVDLIAVPTMVLLYGEGGHLEKQQVVDPTRRSVARLAIQLPSYFTGGEVVIHEEGTDNKKSFALGKKKGVAAFAPHYVVHAAGTYRTVKPVERGYRLAMLYSLCLHPESQYSPGRRLYGSARDQLVVAIRELTKRKEEMQDERATAGEETMIALMLSPSCKKSEVESSGSMALIGEDRGRFELLTASNALLPHEHPLKLNIACLRYELLGYDEDEPAQESMSWYSTFGGELDINLPASFRWTKRFSFLNPGNKTFGQLWKSSQAHGARAHERFAIVGRPVWADIRRPLVLDNGVARFYYGDTVSQIPLTNPQTILNNSPNSAPLQNAKEAGNKSQSTQVELCQDLASNIIASGDITLVESFFKISFARLKEKRPLIPFVADIVKRVIWDNVSTPLLGGISYESFDDRIGLAMELAEQLAGNPIAQAALTLFAVEKARMLYCTFPEKLLALPALQLLFKHALACADPKVLISAAALFNAFGGKQLGRIVDTLSKCVDKSTPPSQRIPIVPIFLRRRRWLIHQIERIKNIERVEDPFSWKMVDTNFPDAGAIATFLDVSYNSRVRSYRQRYGSSQCVVY